MAQLVVIVEGHGEVKAVPHLLRRIALESAAAIPDVAKLIRVGRQRLLKAGELERTVEYAARHARPDGGILILLDADDDCPKDLAEMILQRATVVRSDRRIRVVLAKREYEAWFLAAAESIAGRRGIRADLKGPSDPEAVRDAKGWLSDQMPPTRSYRETLDQESLTIHFDMHQARKRAPSFDKLWRDVESLLRASA